MKFQGHSVVLIRAQDGDLGDSRPISFSIEGDELHYFQLVNSTNGQASVVTSNTPIDRENPLVLESGGVYTFSVKVSILIMKLATLYTQVLQITNL